MVRQQGVDPADHAELEVAQIELVVVLEVVRAVGSGQDEVADQTDRRVERAVEDRGLSEVRDATAFRTLRILTGSLPLILCEFANAGVLLLAGLLQCPHPLFKGRTGLRIVLVLCLRSCGADGDCEEGGERRVSHGAKLNLVANANAFSSKF